MKVHPVVLFSILDHHTRRKSDQKRVIGTLLGYREKGVVHVRNCFPVPHTETETESAVDKDYHQNMFELHQKSNADEEIVGWYASSSEVNKNSVYIHNFYGNELEQPPVHLCIGTDLSSGKMDIDAYVSEPFGSPDSETNVGAQFQSIPLSFADEDEFTGLSSLLACKNEDFNKATPLSETGNIRSSLLSLIQRIEAVRRYVDDVVAGRVQPDRKLGRFLADTMAKASITDMEEYQKAYSTTTQDHLMAIYISNLTRTQLYLSRKLDSIPV
jgi:translation initiation factor 3 subunit F